MIAPGLVQPASAGGWFAAGTGFRVGAAHISFVFGQPFGHYSPAYYYRYDRPISYRGHSCNRYCYRDAGHYYHHESCPLVRAHFRAYNVDPYWAYSRYAPHGDYGHYDGYYSGYYGEGGYYRDDHYRGRSYRGDYYRGDRYRDRHYDNDYRGHRRERRYYREGYRDGRRNDRHYDRDRHRGRRGHRHYRGCGH